MEYTLVRSKRKSIALQVTNEGLIVKVPLKATKKDIEEVLDKHKSWIDTHLNNFNEQKKKAEGMTPITNEDIKRLADEALKVIPERVRYYAPKLGVTYGNITIRNQRTRWGSCSSKGNLNFNCLLMLAPREVLDSVVVHELCHLKEMNHSKRFYSEVLKVFPNYYECDKWLKENGKILMMRME